MALQLRRKVHESVVHIDRDSAPRIISSGMDFLLEDLPVGTRVIYPNAPMKGLPNREAAIRYALNHPHDCDPLYAQLEPGMKVPPTRMSSPSSPNSWSSAPVPPTITSLPDPPWM